MTTGSALVTIGVSVTIVVVAGAGGGGGGAGGSEVLSADVTDSLANWLIPESDAADTGIVGNSNVKPISNAAARENRYFFDIIWTSFRS